MAGVPNQGVSYLAVAAAGIDAVVYPTDDFGTGSSPALAAISVTTGAYAPSLLVAASAVLTPPTITISNATWIASTRSLRKTGAYASYSFMAGDTVWVDSGVPGYYEIESKTDDNNIVLRKHLALTSFAGINATISDVACITKTSAFASYYFRTGDRFQMTAGTGIDSTPYDDTFLNIVAKISDDCIRVKNLSQLSITDLAGNIPNQFLVTKASAFATYDYHTGDVFTITGGTGLTTAAYSFEKLTDSLIRLTTDAGPAAADLAGNIAIGPVRANKSLLRDAKEVLVVGVYSTTPAAADEFNVVDNAGTTVPGLSFKGVGPWDLGPGVVVQGNVGLRVHSVTATSGANVPYIVLQFMRLR